MKLPAACQPVVDAAARMGLRIEVKRFPEGTHTAQDAARAIGVRLGQIVKSIVFLADGEPVLCLVSGPSRVALPVLKKLTHAREVRPATAAEVREMTGFAAGGVPPFGHRTPLPAYFDRDLLAHQTVWAAAGTPDTVFAAVPGALAEACGAVIADLKEA